MKPLAPIELTSSDYRSLVVSRMSFTDAGDNNLKDAFAKPTLWDTTTNTMIAEGKITENAIVFEDLRIEIPGYSTQNYQLRANILTPKMPATFSFSLNHDNNLIARESQTDLRVPLTGQKGYRFMIGLYNTGSTTLTPVPAPIEPKSTVSKPSTTTTTTTTSDTYSLPKNEQKKSVVSSVGTNSQANSNVSVTSRSVVSGEVSFTAKK